MNKYFPDKKDFDLEDFLFSYTDRLSASLKSIDTQSLLDVFNILSGGIEKNVCIYTCGNGGSSSIAEHLVCDFVKGAATDSKIQPKVFPLLSTPTLTAVANDIDYEDVFSYQIEKYGNEDDILLSISSSGNSKNIIKAIEVAKSMKIKTISFVGFDGGVAKDISDVAVHIESDNYGVCEDAHHALMHILAQFLRLRNIDNSEKIGNIKF